MAAPTALPIKLPAEDLTFEATAYYRLLPRHKSATMPTPQPTAAATAFPFKLDFNV